MFLFEKKLKKILKTIWQHVAEAETFRRHGKYVPRNITDSLVFSEIKILNIFLTFIAATFQQHDNLLL